MTVSVVFAIAGVIAFLFGIIGGGIKAREVEVPFLPIVTRVVTVVVGLALIGVAMWLEINRNPAEPLVPTPQGLSSSPASDQPASSNGANMPATSTPQNPSETPTASASNLAQLYAKLDNARTWNLVLQEPFDNNNHNWTLWNVDDAQKSETMQIAQGVLQWGIKIKQSDSWYWEFASLGSYSDFYYSVKVTRVGQPPAAEVNQADWGIIFRRQGDDFYALLLDDLEQYTLYQHTGNDWTELVGSTRSSLINSGGSNQLAVVADRTDITFFINDTAVDSVQNSAFSQGNVGL